LASPQFQVNVALTCAVELFALKVQLSPEQLNVKFATTRGRASRAISWY
jgi:hypothetical protein